MKGYQYLLLSLLIMSCGNKASDTSTKQDNVSADSVTTIQNEPQPEDDIDDTDADIILRTKLKDGRTHEFYQVYSDYCYNLHTRIKGEKESQIVRFAYDRYHDNEPFYTEGLSTPIRYVVSEDKRFIYVIGDIRANSNGWVAEYQIFKVDVETKKAKFLVDCAAIEAVPDGFVIAVARCTNADTAEFTCDEEWLLHDEKIDFDGNTVHVSKKEYDYDTMEERFQSDIEYVFLKGFKSCTEHTED